MPIDVQVIAEHGERLMALDDVTGLVPPPAPPSTHVPLVGRHMRDAFHRSPAWILVAGPAFDQPQAQWLDDELQALADTLTGAERSLARALRLLIAEQLSHPHRYLRFTGN